MTSATGNVSPTSVEEETAQSPLAERPRRFAVAVGFIVLGAAVCVWTVSIGIGTPAAPGPGFWPFVLSVSIIAAAVVFVVVNRDGKGEPFDRRALTGLGLIGAVALFIVLMTYVHFVVASAVLLALGQVLAGERHAVKIAAVTIITTAAAWYLFFVLLGVPTPR